MAKPRQRSTAETAQHVGVDPLALRAPGPKFAFHDFAGRGELQQKRGSHADAEAVTRREFAHGKRPMRTRVAQREISGGITHRFEERLR